MKRIVNLFLCGLLISLFSCFSLQTELFAASDSSECGKYKYPTKDKIDRQVDSIFKKLSTREKIAQIMVIDFTSRDSKEMQAIQNRLVRKEKIGGVIPLGDVFIPAVERLNQLNKLAKIPMLVTLDAEWGASMRWQEMPAFQFFLQLGALSSDSLVYEVGKSIAQECRALKIQVNYSPVLDLNNNPQKHIVNHRSFGEDKEKAALYGIAMMRGMRDGGVAGSAKHFPGHGDTDVDSHLALPVLPFTAQRLDTLELYPFKRLIADGVDMVMVAHLSIPALDPSGTPSSISKPIVTGLLREKLGFDGIICTDALNMKGVSKDSGLEKKDIPLAAYKAGVDILLMPENVEESITVIEQALERGEITMEGLDMRVKKMLALKARLGVFDKGYDPFIDMSQLNRFTDTELKDGIMDKKLDLIKQISKESVTLLFNDNSAGYGVPVSFEGKRVAYVGYKNPQLGHEFGVLANRYGHVDTLILGNDATLVELKSARDRLKNHDLVIFGFNQTDQRQYKNYGLISEEIDFITDWAAEQPMIAVYLGSPYAVENMAHHRNFTSYVIGYSNDKVNNFAAAQVVFGGIPAKGLLPVSVGSFKVGESVLLPDRYREEYHHYIGSKSDSLASVEYDLKQMSAALTLLPQAAELVAGGKIRLSDKLHNLLDEKDISGDIAQNLDFTVEQLFAGYKTGDCVRYLQLLLRKYRSYASIAETAEKMFLQMGMRSTKLSVSDSRSEGNSFPNVITNGYDIAKYRFTINNGGKYEGRQVLSQRAAELVLKYM